MKKVLSLLLALVVTFSLAACGKNEEEVANLADAVQKLTLDLKDPHSVTSDVTLVTSGLNDSTITWSSSNTAVISNEGVVTRPAEGEGDVNVVLTATIKIGDEETTKVFNLTVLEVVTSSSITISVLNSDTVASEQVVVVTGIVTGVVKDSGFHISDDTGFTFVYTATTPDVAIGDEVTVTGAKEVRFNVVQLKDTESVVVNSNGNTTPNFRSTTIVDLYKEDETDPNVYSEMIAFSGFLTLQGQYNNVYLSSYDVDLNLLQVEVYYKSADARLTQLSALTGKNVNVEGSMYGWSSSNSYRLSVDTNATITEATALTDQELANLSVAFADLVVTNGTELSSNLDLSAAMPTGQDVVWTSSDEDVITAAGVITQVDGATGTATLTVTATVGSATASKTYDVTVMELVASTPVTVADALALADGETALVQAVVAGFNYKGYPFLQDDNGVSILVWGTEYDGEIGDEVVVSGTLSDFSGLRQFTEASIVSTESTGNAVVYSTATAAEITTFANFETIQQGIYSMDLVIGTLADGNYTTFVGDGTNVLSLYTLDHPFRDLYTDGDTVTLTFFVSGKGDDYIKMELVDMPFTNTQKLSAVTAAIEVSGNVTSDITLITELATYDAVITWASDNAAVGTDGVVTRPAIGEADVTVTLTASIVIGTDAAVETTFTVVVLAEQEVTSGADLFISEYLEGSGNNKAIELYNPTGTEIDLSLYSVTLNYGSGTVTVDLTGTLASGEVIVYCNSQMASGTALETECDIALSYPTSFITFNGNDTVQLSKGGVVIDQFGAVDAAGGSNFAKDQVWVRNAVVVSGVTTFDTTEWTIVDIDGTVDYLTIGSHTCEEPVAG